MVKSASWLGIGSPFRPQGDSAQCWSIVGGLIATFFYLLKNLTVLKFQEGGLRSFVCFEVELEHVRCSESGTCRRCGLLRGDDVGLG